MADNKRLYSQKLGNFIDDASPTSTTSTLSASAISSLVVSGQQWKPAVNSVANLPSIGGSDVDITWLCRVINPVDPTEDGVYQRVAGSGSSWTLYSDNTDFVNEGELKEALGGTSASNLNDLKLPAHDQPADVGKAVIVKSDNSLELGEAGKVDALKMNDTEYDPVDKVIDLGEVSGFTLPIEGTSGVSVKKYVDDGIIPIVDPSITTFAQLYDMVPDGGTARVYLDNNADYQTLLGMPEAGEYFLSISRKGTSVSMRLDNVTTGKQWYCKTTGNTTPTLAQWQWVNTWGSAFHPDYAKRENINRITSSSGSWTADRNGYVYLHGVSVNATAAFSINNINVLNGWSSSEVHVSGVFPVSIGDVVKAGTSTSSGMQCFFIPPKAVDVAAFTPDYAKIETVNRIPTPSSTWTVPTAGFMRLYAVNAATGTVYFMIDGVQVGASLPALGYKYGLIVPVSAGNVITVDSNTSVSDIGAYFIPPKAVPSVLINETVSATEINTGKTWIDGKPIYRRLFSGTITAAVNAEVSTIISTEAIYDNIVDVKGWIARTSTAYADATYIKVQIGHTFLGSSFYSMVGILGNGNLGILNQSNMARTNAPYQVVVEYTKV